MLSKSTICSSVKIGQTGHSGFFFVTIAVSECLTHSDTGTTENLFELLFFNLGERFNRFDEDFWCMELSNTVLLLLYFAGHSHRWIWLVVFGRPGITLNLHHLGINKDTNNAPNLIWSQLQLQDDQEMMVAFALRHNWLTLNCITRSYILMDSHEQQERPTTHPCGITGW